MKDQIFNEFFHFLFGYNLGCSVHGNRNKKITTLEVNPKRIKSISEKIG